MRGLSSYIRWAMMIMGCLLVAVSFFSGPILKGVILAWGSYGSSESKIVADSIAFDIIALSLSERGRIEKDLKSDGWKIEITGEYVKVSRENVYAKVDFPRKMNIAPNTLSSGKIKITKSSDGRIEVVPYG